MAKGITTPKDMAAPLLLRCVPRAGPEIWAPKTRRSSRFTETSAVVYGRRGVDLAGGECILCDDPPKFPRWPEDPDYWKWKNKEELILEDIEPITLLTKEILHSHRYMDGEGLTADEKAVVEKLLAYHPHSEDKIGCGLDSIMVNQYPQFRQSRCLFVVRTDGGWINLSYQKCLRAYIRHKYSSHAERFIREHFKSGRGAILLRCIYRSKDE